MKNPGRTLSFSIFALLAVGALLATQGCGGGQMGRAGDQVDRSASKTGKVFRGGK